VESGKRKQPGLIVNSKDSREITSVKKVVTWERKNMSILKHISWSNVPPNLQNTK
jgi:ABC-type uncharacterized transport system auxiliary subunit